MKLIDLKDKKIVIVGLGVNNRKMADYFSTHGIKFDVIENWKSPAELADRLPGYEVVFRTPGLPYLSTAIQTAQKSGVIISSQTKLFFDLCPAKIIGITGTKGKGTTASLIYEILKVAGKKVYLGGNFGRDPFEFLDQLNTEDCVVLELSSFQLQDLEKSPHLAVALNITPDHLDHHENMTEYTAAKSNILKNQTESDIAVIHPDLPEKFKSLGLGRKIIIDSGLVKDWPRQLLGHHNLDNIAAAALAVKELGVPESVIKSVVAQFQPLPHRLTVLGQVDGVTYVDDSFSTNSEPVIAAIEAFESPIVLIVGGHDKGIDFTLVSEKIKTSKHVKAVIVIGEMTEKILKTLQGYDGQILSGAKNMQEIVTQAKSAAVSGDLVVLSPGTASFDMFKNATDRAQQFIAEVNRLKQYA